MDYYTTRLCEVAIVEEGFGLAQESLVKASHEEGHAVNIRYVMGVIGVFSVGPLLQETVEFGLKRHASEDAHKDSEEQ